MENFKFDETIRNEPAGSEKERVIEETETEKHLKTEAIAKAESFKELYETVQGIGEIKGKKAEDIIGILTMVENGAHRALAAVTRTYGLRDKATEMFLKKFGHPVEENNL